MTNNSFEKSPESEVYKIEVPSFKNLSNKSPLIPALFGLILLLTIMVFGCDNSYKNQYRGEWVDAKEERDLLMIEKNQDNFIVTYDRDRLPAIYNQGVLEVSIDGFNPRMTYDIKTDRILFMEDEFIRIEHSVLSKFLGVWKLEGPDVGMSAEFIKIERDSNGQIIFQQGSKHENEELYFSHPIYLKFFKGLLNTKFHSNQFRATKGYSIDYEISLQIIQNNRILYKLSGVGEEEYIGTKVSVN